MIVYLAMFVAIASFLGMMAVAFAYRSSLSRDSDPATWYFSVSILLIALSTAIRRLYWDVFWVYLRDHNYDYSRKWIVWFPTEYVNLLFNSFVLVAVYFALRARFELIPDNERTKWRWYSAWVYPDSFKGLVNNVRIQRKRIGKNSR